MYRLYVEQVYKQRPHLEISILKGDVDICGMRAEKQVGENTLLTSKDFPGVTVDMSHHPLFTEKKGVNGIKVYLWPVFY